MPDHGGAVTGYLLRVPRCPPGSSHAFPPAAFHRRGSLSGFRALSARHQFPEFYHDCVQIAIYTEDFRARYQDIRGVMALSPR